MKRNRSKEGEKKKRMGDKLRYRNIFKGESFVDVFSVKSHTHLSIRKTNKKVSKGD